MRKTFQILTFIALSPIWLPLGLLVIIIILVMAIPMSIRGYFEYRAWIRKMRSIGRVRSTSENIEHNETGTLIVDQPGWGGKHKYCWWTPDDIESLAPVDVTPLSDRIAALKSEIRGDGTDLPLDSWVYEQYLSDESGSAYLVSTRNGDNIAENLTKKLAGLKIIETWTAPRSEFGPSNVEPGIAG